jgi:tetratricopeptide (TPR) repeat protein
VVVAALAWAASQQLRHWRDTIALHTRTVAVTESNPYAHYGLAMALVRAERGDEAELHLAESIRLGPDWPPPHLARARLRAQRGQLDPAIEDYRRVLEILPGHAGTSANLGLALVRTGRFEEAEPLLRSALALRADSPELAARWRGRKLADLQLALGDALASQGKLEPALESYQAAGQTEAAANARLNRARRP